MAQPVVRNRSTEAARWDPFAEVEMLSNQLSRILGSSGELASLPEDVFTPVADLEETDDAYIVEIELPGVKKTDIDIHINGRRLTVMGERKEKERAGILRRRTRAVGRFYYEIVLPGEVDYNDVKASLDDGVLTIRVPKASAGLSRRIEVK
jgi:HSP20 family protein